MKYLIHSTTKQLIETKSICQILSQFKKNIYEQSNERIMIVIDTCFVLLAKFS